MRIHKCLHQHGLVLERSGFHGSLEHVKRYGLHRAIERKPSHSKQVKKAQGSRCRACGWDMTEIYGASAKDMIEAHHLRPLSSLADGEKAKLDIHKDFAVLCPNCHRAIHRMEDVSDLAGLVTALKAGAMTPPRSV